MPSIGLSLGKKPVVPNDPKDLKDPKDSKDPTEPEPNRPFTADQLRDAWVGLAATHQEELRLKELIENYMPRLVDELTAEIQMPNPWQMGEMKKALPALLNQIRRALHNNQLEIKIVLAEFNQEQMAFTAEEKYALMAEQNPALTMLKERLNLQID